MKRMLLAVAVLLVVAPFLMAQNNSAPARNGKEVPRDVVVVHPADFRKPLDEPHLNLAPKYDDKTVRFTGVVVGSGKDDKKNVYYDLEVVIPQPNADPPPPPVKPKLGDKAKPAPKVQPGTRKTPPEKVSVRIYLRFDDPRLKNSPAGQVNVTVEGTGQVLIGTWNLVINEARVVSVNAAP